MERRVLIVDDEPAVLSAISRLLRRAGIDTIKAASAAEAIKAMESDPLPVVISDYQMPGVTGTELLATIEAGWPETYRIILSAHSDFDTVLKAIRNGAVHKFLAKPWSDNDLISLLEKHFSRFQNSDSEVVAETFATTPSLLPDSGELVASLKAKEIQLQKTLDTVLDGVLTTDDQGTILSVNSALEAMFGYQPVELVGEHCQMLVPALDHSVTTLADLLPKGQRRLGVSQKLVGLKKNGEVFPIELGVNTMEMEGAKQYLGMVRDISEVMRAERENELLLEALENCQNGFALIGPGGKLIHCNHQFRELYSRCEMPPDEGVRYGDFLQGCLASGLFPEFHEDSEQWLATEVAALSEETRSCEYRLDEHRWVQIQQTRTRHEGTIAFHLDITDQKNNQLALIDAARVAEEANSARGRFLAMMSHEIRTPLNGVLGLLQLMQQTSLDTEQREYVDTALESGQGLLTVISDILDFSKIEADKLELQPRSTDLRSLLESLKDLLAPRVEEKSIHFELVCEAYVPRLVVVDPHRLRQVLLNLAGNAVKFTDYGGVKVEVSVEAEQIVFAIEDSGTGIPEHEQRKLFSEFTTIEQPEGRNIEGTGLGLSISQKLVALMGGKIHFSSEEGRGSRFWFAIPLQRVEQTESDVAGSQPLESSFCGRVLVVDDSQTNRLVARMMLKKVGLDVDEVSSGEQAIVISDLCDYDLILMDISMPGMSGVETTQHLRALCLEQLPPIVALTAYAMPGDKERFLAAGMSDYIEKPIDRERLLEVIAPYLRSVSSQVRSDPTSVSQQLFDKEVLERLISDTSEEVFPELLEIFRTDVVERIDALKQAFAAGDLVTAARQFHTLGSSAALYGLIELRDRSRELERDCESKPTALPEDLAAFIQLAETSVSDLVAYSERRSEAI